MSSTPLSHLGTEYTTPDHSPGMGTTLANPATIISDMVQSQHYFRELGNETDVVLLSAENYLINAYKTMSVMKLMQQFVVRSTLTGGQHKLRWVHRSLATVFTFEQALRAVGENVTVSDDFSNLTAINQQLAPLYIQCFLSS